MLESIVNSFLPRIFTELQYIRNCLLVISACLIFICFSLIMHKMKGK